MPYSRTWFAAGVPLVVAAQFALTGTAGVASGPAPPAPLRSSPLTVLAPILGVQITGESSGFEAQVEELSGTEVDCLTSAVYYEARSESEEGQRAVAQVVMNRVRHPAYPKSVCGVVYQGSNRRTGCQFTFTCDGSIAHRPELSAWSRARRIAAEALSGQSYSRVGNATHYHTRAVLPYWAHSLPRLGAIGEHIFYSSGRLSAAAVPSFASISRAPEFSGARVEKAAIFIEDEAETPRARKAGKADVVLVHRGSSEAVTEGVASTS